MIQTQENGEKPCLGPDLGTLGPNSGHQFFFLKIWLRQSLDIMVSYHHVKYQKKLKIKSWENLVTERQTDGQMDTSDFRGRCLTDVEHQRIRTHLWVWNGPKIVHFPKTGFFPKRQHYIFYLPIVLLHCVNMKTDRADTENLNLQQMGILLVSEYLGGGIIFCLTKSRNNSFQAPNTLRLLNFPIQLQYP